MKLKRIVLDLIVENFSEDSRKTKPLDNLRGRSFHFYFAISAYLQIFHFQECKTRL